MQTTTSMLTGLRALVDNPTPRVPVALCLDVSSSMSGKPIDELNAGVAQFLQEMRDDDLTLYSAETAVVTFSDGANCVADFDTADHLQVEKLKADGITCMGEGLALALDRLEQRKNSYKQMGIDYYQPILVVMSDGYPNGSPSVLQDAVERIRKMVAARRLTVIAVGIGDGADLETLKKLTGRQPVQLHQLRFREFFAWLSQSVANVSASMPGDEPVLDMADLEALAAEPWPEGTL